MKKMKEFKDAVTSLGFSETDMVKIAQYMFMLESLNGVTSATVDILDGLRVTINKVDNEKDKKWIALSILNEYSEEVDEILVERVMLEEFGSGDFSKSA